jgi:hypothetical protein
MTLGTWLGAGGCHPKEMPLFKLDRARLPATAPILNGEIIGTTLAAQDVPQTSFTQVEENSSYRS